MTRDESELNDHFEDLQDHIKDLQRIIHNLTRRLRRREAQVALLGPTADPALSFEIEDLEKEIEIKKAERKAYQEQLKTVQQALEDIPRKHKALEDITGGRMFINREDELGLILSSSAPAYYFLDGPPGYGKTTLLKELARRFTERNWQCARL
jgi:DNA repair exonuclease SbcCD ATPase subunit